jgi:hypothetical protein
MQQLRTIVQRIAPHFHVPEHPDVPPLSDEEREMHLRNGILADEWSNRIKAKADELEADMQRGIDDLRREADLMSDDFNPQHGVDP